MAEIRLAPCQGEQSHAQRAAFERAKQIVDKHQRSDVNADVLAIKADLERHGFTVTLIQ